MHLSTLANAGVGKLKGPDVEFSGVSTDSRTVQSHELYIALKGERFDGHDFTADVKERGAAALVVERPSNTGLSELQVPDTTIALGKIGAQYRRECAGRILGLTGSCGKTSVKGMLESILQLSHNTVATKGNLNNHIGVPLTLCRLAHSTEFAVVEAGTSGKDEIAYLTSLIAPDTAVVINVHAAHLEGFGSLSAIAKEKSAIYGDPRTTTAVINADSDFFDTFIAATSGKQRVFFSVRPKSQLDSREGLMRDRLISCEEIQLDNFGRASLVIGIEGERLPVKLSVLGGHHVENAVAAAAVAHTEGVPHDDIITGLARYSGSAGRMELHHLKSGAVVVDDSYNANPASMRAAIDYLSGFPVSVFVCGDMGEIGEKSAAFHQDLGEYAKNKGVEHLFSMGQFASDYARGYGSHAQTFDSCEALIQGVRAVVGSDSVVLVKGSRSARMERVVVALVKDEVV